jgi:hypothetical protein
MYVKQNRYQSNNSFFFSSQLSILSIFAENELRRFYDQRMNFIIENEYKLYIISPL